MKVFGESIRTVAEFRSRVAAVSGVIVINDPAKSTPIAHSVAGCGFLAEQNFLTNARREQDAYQWFPSLEDAVKAGARPCKRCEQRSLRAASAKGPTRTMAPESARPIAAGTDGPFREAAAEAILAAHLQAEGYAIESRVLVSSGIVDLVATKGSEKLVVEVKGEDAGGYGTTQMNFQLGVGQLASRMTDDQVRYVLAFPLTAHFRRVLKTFAGSIAFERLGIDLIAVLADGAVRRIGAGRVRDWIESLSTPA